MEDLKEKICKALEKIECHRDVEIVDDSMRRGFSFLIKGQEILFISVVETSQFPQDIRSMLKSKDRFWCKREHGAETDHYDPYECEDQLCMLIPNWAIGA